MQHGSEKTVTFFSCVYSIIPPFFLKWQNQIFLPLNFTSFLLSQMGPQSLGTQKTCHGIIGCMEERRFSKKHNTSHIELGESPGSLRHMKQLSLCLYYRQEVPAVQPDYLVTARQTAPASANTVSIKIKDYCVLKCLLGGLVLQVTLKNQLAIKNPKYFYYIYGVQSCF